MLLEFVDETHTEWESFIRSPDGDIEFGYVTKEGIVSMFNDRQIRIKALRMFIGFEVEEIAGILNITRQTYRKNESLGFEKGITEDHLKLLISKSIEKLYASGENPKYGDLWWFLIRRTEDFIAVEEVDSRVHLLACEYNHTFEQAYGECPFCEILDLEITEYTEVEKLRDISVVNENAELIIHETLSEVSKIRPEEPGDLFERRKDRLLNKKLDDSSRIIYQNPPKDTEVIKDQLNRVIQDIENTNIDLTELIHKSRFLLIQLYQSALPEGLFSKYLADKKTHKATVDDYLKDAKLPLSDVFDKKEKEMLQYLATIMFNENQDW